MSNFLFKFFSAFLCSFFACPIFIFSRSIDDIFPALDGAIKNAALSDSGYYNYYDNAKSNMLHIPVPAILKDKINLEQKIIKKNMCIIESLFVLKNEKFKKKINMIDFYNAIGKTRSLAGRKYFSHTRKKEVVLFNTVYRIANQNSSAIISDPALVQTIPQHEIIDFLVDDINFGKCYYQTEFFNTAPSCLYTIKNIRSINLLFFTIVKKENLYIHFYVESIDEGILIYTIMNFEPEEIAASRIDISSAAKKRLDVIKGWLVDGMTN